MPKPKYGQITDVDIRDNGEIFVTVSISPSRESRNARFRKPAPNMWVVPQVGNVVEVNYHAGGQPIAQFPLGVPGNFSPDNLSEGEIAIKLSPNTTLRFRETSPGQYDVDLECDGTLSLDADAIELGENGEALATASHTHSSPDGGGTTSGPSDTTDITKAE